LVAGGSGILAKPDGTVSQSARPTGQNTVKARPTIEPSVIVASWMSWVSL
jgi:hypothetical protein